MISQGIIEGIVGYYLAQAPEPIVVVVGPDNTALTRRVIDTPGVRTILLDVDSPGGTVGLSDPETVRHRGIAMHEVRADLIAPVPMYKPPLPVCPPKEYGQNRKRKNWKRK